MGQVADPATMPDRASAQLVARRYTERMDVAEHQTAKVALRNELEAARAAFHALLDSLTDEDLRRPSNNPGWTNGEVLFHMTLAFILVPILVPMLGFWGRLPRRYSKRFAGILNASTGLFNIVNGLGPRIGGRIFSRERLRKQFDRTHDAIMRRVDSASEAAWGQGMHYPTRWEPLFQDYMTLEDVLRYPTIHLAFHMDHVSRSGGASAILAT